MKIFQVFCQLLRDRLMVGHIPLEDDILVRVQVPQLVNIIKLMKESFEQKNNISTPERLRTAVDKAIDLLVNTFNVEGKEELVNFIENNPDAKFIIASSHFSNLDAPSA